MVKTYSIPAKQKFSSLNGQMSSDKLKENLQGCKFPNKLHAPMSPIFSEVL